MEPQAQALYPESLPQPRFVPNYQFFDTEGRLIHEVAFFPVDGAPGFSHRVVIDSLAIDWLGYGKPSTKAATYFLRKHWDRLSQIAEAL